MKNEECKSGALRVAVLRRVTPIAIGAAPRFGVNPPENVKLQNDEGRM